MGDQQEAAFELAIAEFVDLLDQGSAPDPEAFAKSVDLDEERRAELVERLHDMLFVRSILPAQKIEEKRYGVAPEMLGDFRLLQQIGRGGMGVVFLARQSSLERNVAVKVLPPGLTLTERQVARFQREAKAVARLSHPNIVPIYTVDCQGDTHYFAMEYIDGHGLSDELTRRRPDAPADVQAEAILPEYNSPGWIRATAGICADVASALDTAHRAGIVHRDVKPQNILLDRKAKAHLVDFGLARDKQQGTITQTGDLAGTPYYMSPEQALTRRMRVDHRTDVYSLGVVLYELLTMRRPFEGRTSQEILLRITNHEPENLRKVNPLVPEDLETICHKAMAKRPEVRYASAADLEADLRRFLAGEPIQAKAPSTARKLRWWFDRQTAPKKAAMTGAAAVALTALAVSSAKDSLARSEWPELELGPSMTSGSPDSEGAEITLFRKDPLTDGEATVGTFTSPSTDKIEPGSYRLEARKGELTFEQNQSLPLGGGKIYMGLFLKKPDSLDVAVIDTDLVWDFGFAKTEPTADLPPGVKLPPTPKQFQLRTVQMKPFEISKRLVSNLEYRQYYLLQTQSGVQVQRPLFWPEPYDSSWDNKPVVGLAWAAMQQYANWRGYRLPTAYESQRAHSGAQGLTWPNSTVAAGSYPSCARLDGKGPDGIPSSEVPPDFVFGNLGEVDECPELRGPEGLYGGIGGVNEATTTPLFEFPADGKPRLAAPAQYIVSGSPWWMPSKAKPGLRDFATVAEHEQGLCYVGFRLARTLDQ